MKQQHELFADATEYHYPSTRYQGSKRKLLRQLRGVFEGLGFKSAIDLFSGSGSVSYLLRTLNKNVIANDYLLFNANTASVFLSTINVNELQNCRLMLKDLLYTKPSNERFLVRKNFENIFFTENENQEIDRFCCNLVDVDSRLRPPLIYAVGQALLKKRPYNLFHRANLSMRLASVERSFGNKKTWDTSIERHAEKALDELMKMSLIDLPPGRSMSLNTANLKSFPETVDFVYLDPPYIPRVGTAIDYCDFYCFLDGLVDYSLFEKGNDALNHKPILKLDSAWATPESALKELSKICGKWPNAQLAFSYRADSALPIEAIVQTISSSKRHVQLKSLSTYKYALAHSKTSEEVLILSTHRLA